MPPRRPVIRALEVIEAVLADVVLQAHGPVRAAARLAEDWEALVAGEGREPEAGPIRSVVLVVGTRQPGVTIEGFLRHSVRADFLEVDFDRRSPGVGGVPRTHIDIGVHVHENAASMCARAVPHVAGCIAVAPRPLERRCRSGGCGRGGSDPPFGMPGTASGRVDMCTHLPPSPAGSLPARYPSGKGFQRRCQAADHPVR